MHARACRPATTTPKRGEYSFAGQIILTLNLPNCGTELDKTNMDMHACLDIQPYGGSASF